MKENNYTDIHYSYTPMHCPNCQGNILKPKKLENGLITLACDNCNGALLSVLQYIHYRDITGDIHPSDITSVFEIDESSHALDCPKCSGFMTKYRISNQTNNRLDLCFRCYEVWFDTGEWQLLQQLDLQNKLPDIFSHEWQKQLVFEIVEEVKTKHYKGNFGLNYKRIDQFKQWLENYDKKAEVLNFLKQ